MDKDCVKCNETKADVACTRCGANYHLSCIPIRITRNELFVCPECTREIASVPTTTSGEYGIQVPPRETVFGPGAEFVPVGNSTVLPQGARPKTSVINGSERVAALERTIKELRAEAAVRDAQFAEMRTLLESLSLGNIYKMAAHTNTEGAAHTHATASHPSQIGNLTTGIDSNTNQNGSQNNSLDSSLWRTRLPQDLVRESLSVRPLSKDQLARRKLGTALPSFDGNPITWTYFVKRFLETSGNMCGYTQSEDMDRVKAALKGRALSVVQMYLQNPSNLDHVMHRLQQSFGQPVMLLSAVQEQVARIPSLKDNLSNIAEFAGEVDQVRVLANQVKEHPISATIILDLEMKLPLAYAEMWLDRKGRYSVGDINQFADFLLDRHDRIIALHRFNPRPPVTATKKVLLLAEQGQEELQDGQATESLGGDTCETVNTIFHQPGGVVKSCVFKCDVDHVWPVCPRFKQLSVKRRWDMANRYRRCYRCLAPHRRNDCNSTALCNINHCEKEHHPLLHPSGPVVDEVLSCTRASRANSVFFRLVPVIIRYGDRSMSAVVLLDSGSSVTLLNEKLADEMEMVGEEASLALAWTDGSTRSVQKTKRVTMELVNCINGESYRLQANTYKDLKLPGNSITNDILLNENLSHLPIQCGALQRPQLLIGQDNAALMRTLRSYEGRSGTVFASETPLGFAFEGELSPRDQVCLMNHIPTDRRMERALMDHIDREHYGLGPDDAVHYESNDHMRARAQMETNTVWKGERYEAGLLWRTDDVRLPDNRQNVLQRHLKFEQKLASDPVKHQKVVELMRSYKEKGYVRAACPPIVPGRVWYLPIFTVTNPAKPDKTRVVWDCAAQFRGVSLNSQLLSGPDLTQPLVSVLLRFRRHRYAISGDIAEMFQQVGLREEDRCSQRFFWRESTEEELQELEMCVLSFGLSCAPTLAQYAKNCNADRFKDASPAAVAAIRDDHYVDDGLFSAHTEEELLKLTQDVRDVHQRGGFRMHKFVSNSPSALRELGVDPQEEAKEVQLSSSAILGLLWNVSADELAFRFDRQRFRSELMNGTGCPTKREMLSVVMSIFDPLGLVSFLCVEAKIVLREACKLAAGWDDKLDGEIQRRWGNWTKSLETLDTILIPRWHGTVNGPVELHIFVDASDKAVCATCYVVQADEEGVKKSSLCFAKCLLAPIRTRSIPQLELDAAVLGVRVLGIVNKAKAWGSARVTFWTDARDVLYWLRSTTRKYTPYVANRVSTILKASTLDQWRWVPTNDNPADWGTKWCVRGGNTALWWHGPDFLRGEETDWPECVLEGSALITVRPLLTVVKVPERRRSLIPDVTRFTSWRRLVNTCAMALKFVEILRKRTFPGPLSADEIARGERELFLASQGGLLRDGKHTKFLSSLSPFIDEYGTLRMRGRTARSINLTFDARFPVILPHDHPITELLIMYHHRHGNHQNTSAVINELRQRAVFAQMRTTVMKVINKCRLCSVRRTRPIIPEMGALPQCRMAVYAPPFSYTGVDYFGPISVLIGRRHEKRWVALFTCLTTHAIYLELVHSLSTESCCAALDSLIARRGRPREIYSDNGTCFVGAAKEYLSSTGERIKWTFIPPKTPTMGGAWERLVGAVKAALTNLGLPRTPSEERLRRALYQAECLVNRRPLTEIPVDPEEEECLTPNHFLLGSSNGSKPESTIAEWQPRKALADWERIVGHFWERFRTEYLPTISARSKWRTKVEPLKVGDVVFLCDDDHRSGWQRGRVVEALMDKESDQVRQVVVETADGRRYRRGVTKVAPILRMTDDEAAVRSKDVAGTE